MKRAMRRPEERVDLNTYGQRLEAQGRRAAAAAPSAEGGRQRTARQKVRAIATAAARRLLQDRAWRPPPFGP